MEGIKKPFKVLLAPLDWGLGHATRCIPIIKVFVELGCQVVIAADGEVAKLLAIEFVGIEIKNLPGYQISYGKKGAFLSLLFQLPRIFKIIKRERKWLTHLLSNESFDLIISDNRPGFRSEKVKSIYITHQLSILSGRGKWPDKILQKLHEAYYKKFHLVWIPDLGGDINLAGELSHKRHLKLQTQHLGLLSRLAFKATATKYDLLILLSGPEPQRTILEQKIIKQLQEYKGTVMLVRGLPGTMQQLSGLGSNIEIQNHLSAVKLQEVMLASKFILCRSGYTTLMDLIKLRKKALLIPTPGQPEQEYLAAYMQRQCYFPYIVQKEFQLTDALNKASTFSFTNPFSKNDFEQHRSIIDQLLTEMRKNRI